MKNKTSRIVREVKSILNRIKRSKVYLIGYILHGNCLLQHVIEGKVQGRTEAKGRQGRRRKQLLDDPKEKSG